MRAGRLFGSVKLRKASRCSLLCSRVLAEPYLYVGAHGPGVLFDPVMLQVITCQTAQFQDTWLHTAAPDVHKSGKSRTHIHCS